MKIYKRKSEFTKLTSWGFGHVETFAFLAVVIVIGLVGAKVLLGGSHAASGRPICMHEYTWLCWTGNGVGGEVYVSSPGNTWGTLVAGNNYFDFINGSGHCLKAVSPNFVTVTSGRCNALDHTETWHAYKESLQNEYFGCYLVANHINPYYVSCHSGPVPQGLDWHWTGY